MFKLARTFSIIRTFRNYEFVHICNDIYKRISFAYVLYFHLKEIIKLYNKLFLLLCIHHACHHYYVYITLRMGCS